MALFKKAPKHIVVETDGQSTKEQVNEITVLCDLIDIELKTLSKLKDEICKKAKNIKREL